MKYSVPKQSCLLLEKIKRKLLKSFSKIFKMIHWVQRILCFHFPHACDSFRSFYFQNSKFFFRKRQKYNYFQKSVCINCFLGDFFSKTKYKNLKYFFCLIAIAFLFLQSKRFKNYLFLLISITVQRIITYHDFTAQKLKNSSDVVVSDGSLISFLVVVVNR